MKGVGEIVCAQSLNESRRTLRHSCVQVAITLLPDPEFERSRIGRLAAEIIQADAEPMPGCLAEQLFQRLGFDFYLLESPLLICAAAVRGVPVTEIRQQAPISTRHTPVGDFVQGATKIVLSKNDPVLRMQGIGRQVLRLRSPAHQNGVVIAGETGLEEADQILAIVIHGRLDNVGQVVRMGRFSSD